MLRALVLIVIVLVVVAAIAAFAGPGRAAEHPDDRRLSDGATTTLIVLAMLAVGLAVVLGVTAGDMWPLLPIGGWIGVYLYLRERARTRPRRERAESERKQRATVDRVQEFGADGVALMDRADAAIHCVMSSEAATEGWLGDLDFGPDTSMIADTLRRITALRGAAEELAALPHATADDEMRLQEAQHTIGALREAVANRVQILDDCALQAEKVDRTLRRQREQDAISARRDDVRGRLDAMVKGAEETPNGEPSTGTDMVQARVAAFLELKGVIEEQRRTA